MRLQHEIASTFLVSSTNLVHTVRLDDLDELCGMNITGVHAARGEIPRQLKYMNINIGASRAFSFTLQDLISAQQADVDLLSMLRSSDDDVIVPIEDAKYMQVELSFRFDADLVSAQETFETVDEILRVPVFGATDTWIWVDSGEGDGDGDGEYHQGTVVTFDDKLVSVRKPMPFTVEMPILTLKLTEGGSLSDAASSPPSYTREFWDLLTIDPAVTTLELAHRYATNHRLRPLNHDTLQQAMDRGVPFEARIVNILRVQEYMAGLAIYHG